MTVGRRTAILAALFGLYASAGLPALAQQQAPFLIAPEILDNTRRLDDDELHMCLNMSSVLVELDRAVGTAIADALLLEPVFYEVVYPRPETYDYRIPLNGTQLFTTMNNHCDAFLGYRAAVNAVPEWLTVSQPYFTSHMLFVTSNPSYRSFGDIAAGDKVGARLGGTGHREMITYLQSQPDDGRARQVPYPNNKVLVERLGDGSIATALVWEYAPAFVTQGDVGSLKIQAAFDAPFTIPELRFSLALMREDTFVRGLIDDAISSLLADGVIDQLMQEHLPAPIAPS